MARYMWVLGLGMLGGCVAPPGEMYVDSRFTINEQNEIQKAADAWEAKTGGVGHVTFIWGYVLGSGPPGRQIMVRVDGEVFDGAIGRTDWTAEDEHMYIDTRADTDLRTIVLHELGHHFTHCHGHLGPGTVMSAFTGSISKTLTQADVDYFYGSCR